MSQTEAVKPLTLGSWVLTPRFGRPPTGAIPRTITRRTANLPETPVIAIDATVYVGTDIGVFATSTGTPNWAEVGPAAWRPGFLPNAAVMALNIFNSGGLKRLRAARFGRGIWEWNLSTMPDFQTAMAGRTATFAGVLYPLNGYSSSVSLSCTAGFRSPPQSCLTSLTDLTPTPALTTQVNSTVVFNGTLAALNGYSSLVSLGCAAGRPAFMCSELRNAYPG